MAKVAVSRASENTALAAARDRANRTSLRSVVDNKDALIETIVHTSVELRRTVACALLVNRVDGIDAMRRVMQKRHGIENHRREIEQTVCIALNTQRNCMRLRESEYVMLAMYGAPTIANAAIDDLVATND